MARGKIGNNPNLQKVKVKKKDEDLLHTTRNKRVRFDYKFVKLVSRLIASGLNQKEVAWYLGVRQETISRWRKKYSLFNRAIEDGKAMAVTGLIHSGLRAACGYDYDEIQTKFVRKEGEGGETEMVEVEKKVTKKKMAPNAHLLTFFLTNLDPDNFRKRVEVDSRSVKINMSQDQVEAGIKEIAGKLAELDNNESANEIMDAEFEQ